MHPGMMAWWKWKHAEHRGHGHCTPDHEGGPGHEGPPGASHGHGPGHEWRGRQRGCGPWAEAAAEAFASGDAFDSDYGGGSFGVRRPLRFLAHRLDLDEKQVADLAHLLSELKTERAQAAVDHRRTVSGFADIIAGEAFDEAKAGAVAAERVKSAERMREALVKALGRIHALLRADQRAKFAYLIRTGALSL
jgi:Spy/CpxP family protein refolding chaperone